jgi:aminopeptidase N
MYVCIYIYLNIYLGMVLYFKKHDGGAVTCDDFRAAMADANNLTLQPYPLNYPVRSSTPTLLISNP